MKKAIVSILFSLLLSWSATAQTADAPTEPTTPFSPAINFISRYAEMSKPPVDTDGVRHASESGLRFIIGNATMLQRLPEDVTLNLSLTDNLYVASWSTGDKVLVECQFPADVTLIMSKDAVALENTLIDRLRTVENKVTPRPIQKVEALQKIPYSPNFYADSHGYYITPILKNEVIYQTTAATDTLATMLTDFDKYRLESLANMMLSGYAEDNTEITVKVSQYGFKHTEITLPLTALHSALAENGSTPYWGVERSAGDKVRGMLLWHNAYLGYVHVMSVDADFSNGLSLKARLMPYVRMDNVTALFGELEEK